MTNQATFKPITLTDDSFISIEDSISKEKANIDKTKIKSANSTVNTINKYSKFISSIDMEKYGKTDKETIKESLVNLISVCKKAK